ncbi:hypothetical protein [Herpetosiphon geysericola]|nr:hypothetical protein [Herpetosiphon geysericola]
MIRDPAIGPGTLDINAYGAASSYQDLLYTARWSTTKYGDWMSVSTIQLSGRDAERYSIETDQRLYIAPSGGDACDLAHIGSLMCSIPDSSRRQWTSIEGAAYKFLAPNSTWVASLSRYNYVGGALTFQSTVWSLNGNGALQSGTIAISNLTPCDVLMFNCYLNQAATTLGTGIVAGTRTVTPASMTGIAVGNKLAIGGTNPEEVTVTATTGTTFTAVFQYAHLAADSVSRVWEGETGDVYLEVTGQRLKTTTTGTVDAREILIDLAAHIATENPDWVNTSSAGLQSQGVDLRNEVYEDMRHLAIVQHLLLYGDSSTRRWEFAIWEDLQAYFRPRGTGGRQWFIYGMPPLERDLEQSANAVYAIYADAAGTTRRTAPTINTADRQQINLRRDLAITVDTDQPATALAMRDVAAADAVDSGAYGSMPIDYVYTPQGVAMPAYIVRPGDTAIISAGPFGFSTASGKGRAFVIASVSVDASDRSKLPSVSISPDARSPRMASYQARRENLK